VRHQSATWIVDAIVGARGRSNGLQVLRRNRTRALDDARRLPPHAPRALMLNTGVGGANGDPLDRLRPAAVYSAGEIRFPETA